MEKTFIKMLDARKAETLKNQGFFYMREIFNGKEIFAFVVTPELLSFLNQNFAKSDFIYSSHLML